MINIQSLRKSYNKKIVLQIPELKIPQSECFGLVGNNGAGKTTLFRLILDLVRPTDGHVLIKGDDVSRHEEWKAYTGAYLDEHMLLSYLTPDEYFDTLQNIYEMSERDLRLFFDGFTDFFNDEILGQKKLIRDLSKGNVKKVGIAAALMSNPELVLLDEPFENLDPTSQNRLQKLILQQTQEQGTTFLISSHNLTHVTQIADRIVLLEKGKIIKDLRESKETMTEELNAYFNDH